MFEKSYQTLARVFDHVSKHLELSLKNSAAPRLSTSVLSVWKHDETLMRVFDILRKNVYDSLKMRITLVLNRYAAEMFHRMHFSLCV